MLGYYYILFFIISKIVFLLYKKTNDKKEAAKNVQSFIIWSNKAIHMCKSQNLFKNVLIHRTTKGQIIK